MDYSFSELELSLQRAAKEFASKSVQPQAAEIDRSNRFPHDLAAKMAELGYRGLPYPANYGGSEVGYTGYALVLEQICQASMTVGAIMAINTVTEEAIFRFGNEWQKKTFLTPLTKGKSLGCIAFTEPDTGSDPKLITTTARKTNGGYIITGQKQFVALASAANLALIFAKRDGEGLSAFIVDTDSQGFNVGEPLETIGLRGLGTSTLSLDEVYVPEENLLGEEGQGFPILLEAMSVARLGVSVEALAVAQAALQLSIEYARKRKALGKPIIKMPTIGWHLAEMATRVEACRWLTYQTAFLRNSGKDIKYQSSISKLFASRIPVEVTGMAMQVCGSYGTEKSMPIERLYRDAKMTEIYVGTSEIQRNIISSYLDRE